MAANFKPYLSSGTIAAGAVGVLALYGSDQWLEPTMPLILGAAAALPISIVGALLLHPEARNAPSRFLVIGLTALVGALVGVGVPALWLAPQVRAGVAKAAPSVVDLYGALEDPDQNVQLEACRQLFAGHGELDGISDALTGRPRLATRCLTDVGEANRAAIVAANLESDWYDRLMTQAPVDDENQCLHAQALVSLPVDAGAKQTDLLNCAFRSPSKAKRTCCADSLAQMNASCESLAGSLDAGKLVRSGAAADLMALSFGEATAKREFTEIASKVDLTCEKMQMVGVQLACVALGGESNRTRAREVLDWLVDENDRCLDGERGESSVTPSQVCDALIERIQRQGKVDGDMVCKSHQKVLQEQAALMEEIKGLSAEESAALAGQISAGNSQASDQMLSLDQFAAAAQSNRGEALKSYNKEQVRQMMERARQQAPSPEELGTKPFQNLQAIQDTANKMMGEDKAQAQFKESGITPNTEVLGEKTKKGMEQIQGAQERLKGEQAKAKHEHKRDK
jgi:hypothetical protein